MRAARYEILVLEELHRILIEPGSQAPNLARPGETNGGVRVERIYLDESGPEHEIAILFRDLGRPECLFGYRIEAVETLDVLNEATSPYTDLMSAAQVWGRSCGSSSKRRPLPSAAGCPAPAPPRSSCSHRHTGVETPSEPPREGGGLYRWRNRNVTWPSPS